MLILGILVLFVIIFWLSLAIHHYPKGNLTAKEIELIHTYGLIHYTQDKNVEGILNSGVKAGRNMTPFEKGMTWYFINDPSEELINLYSICKKGDRATYNASVYIKDIPEGIINKLKIRRSLGYIAFRGNLKTSNMSYKIYK